MSKSQFLREYKLVVVGGGGNTFFLIIPYLLRIINNA